MQPIREPVNLSLTPQLVATLDGYTYRSINDYHATIIPREAEDGITITVQGTLTDNLPFTLRYYLADDRVTISAAVPAAPPDAELCYILPIVSPNTEPVELHGTTATITKPKATVRLTSTHPPALYDCDRPRLFSPVPGHEAVPLMYKFSSGEMVEVGIEVQH
jgi:hypothetical protein